MVLEVQEAGVGVGEGVSVMIKIVLLGLDFFFPSSKARQLQT